jgi:pyridoxamine 5'-phosphate oxidase
MQEYHDLKKMRLNYEQDQLLESSINKNPFQQFKIWFENVIAANIVEPNAMTLATADKNGFPSARVVLLKEFNESGFIFYTNYLSRKGKEISENPYAAILFWWKELERQVRIEGKIEKISRKLSEEYFKQRPLKSRYGALASNQSEVVENREVLEKRFTKLEKQFVDNPPTPESWGGYQLIPTKFEFWQGRENRLHDRICYVKNKNDWKIYRLQP